MKGKADHEFDGYLCVPDGRKFLCDIKIWLPRDPSTDATLRVVLIGINANDMGHLGLVRLISAETVDAVGLSFEATEVFIRSANSHIHSRLAGGTKLSITHVGAWRIEKNYGASGNSTLLQENSMPIIDSLIYILSEVEYGSPHVGVTVDFRGNRFVDELSKPKVLLMVGSNEQVLCEWELQRHWHWVVNQRNKASATSYPVLCVRNVSEKSSALSLEELARLTDDACLILTLATRHRVVVHTVFSSSRGNIVEDWRNPLKRQRATTEEEATGPLIDAVDCEDYFQHTARWWNGLDSTQRDSVRLAIFSLNPSTEKTLEDQFLSRFSALEGLVKRWGPGNGALSSKTKSMLEKYPPLIGGLWPLFDKTNGEPLYWVRNELAHGRQVLKLAEGALPLANDHLQLWLEHILLALSGYRRSIHQSDWLGSQVTQQREQIRTLSQLLRQQSNASNTK